MLRRPPSQSSQRKHRINREITAPEVRLINTEGQQVGVMPLKEAMAHAEEAGIDLRRESYRMRSRRFARSSITVSSATRSPRRLKRLGRNRRS